MVVDVGQDASWELSEQFRPNAGRIGTVDCDGDAVSCVIVGGFDELNALGVRDEIRGDAITVHADRVDAFGQEHATEGGLRADAVPVGSHMA